MCDTLTTSFDFPATVHQKRFCIALRHPSARAFQPHRHNPYYTFFHSFYSPSFSNNCLLLRYYGIIAHLTTTLLICCQFLSISYFSFFFWISFIQDLVWFIDFQFLIFSSSYSFPYPGNTLSGRSVLCTVSDKNIRSLDQQRDLGLFGNFSLKFLRVRRV